jgi:hypothetical protein
MPRRRVVLMAGLGCVFAVAAVSGQLVKPILPPEDSMALLLIEVRAIRSDLNQAAAASLRLQVLLASSNVLEHRIGALATQLAAVRQQQLANVGKGPQTNEQALRAQEAELVALLAAEQARRDRGDAQLDDLARSLPIDVGR